MTSDERSSVHARIINTHDKMHNVHCLLFLDTNLPRLTDINLCGFHVAFNDDAER